MEIFYDKARLVELRRLLHRHPELSGQEHQTAGRVKRLLMDDQPDQLIEQLGGAGLAAVYEGQEPGPALLFRCDLDALPIEEVNDLAYRSQHQGRAHKCGHDGHMAIMNGLSMAISANRPRRGRAILLYQPSEENGQGARRVLEDERFPQIAPDKVFALHNLPGYAAGSVVLKSGTFAAASKGMVSQLYGKTAHAGEPENGRSPGIAMADIVRDLTWLPQNWSFEDFALITVIHARLGEIAFGTTPGYAEVMATLRTYSNPDMDQLTSRAVDIVQQHARSHSLENEISWREAFPATVNDNAELEMLREVARKERAPMVELDAPLRWSEDFSNFTLKYPGVLFGLGSGEHTPQLHNPDYDFPEEIIEPGIRIFYGIYRHYLK